MSAKLRIICDGRGTIVELDGKTMSKGIEHVKFEHVGADRKVFTEFPSTRRK